MTLPGIGFSAMRAVTLLAAGALSACSAPPKAPGPGSPAAGTTVSPSPPPAATEGMEARAPTCTAREPIPLGNPREPHLRALSRYQEICGSFVTNRLMIFTALPGDSLEAASMANGLTSTLRAFADAGVTPIVIVEPTTPDGLIGFLDFKKGYYEDLLHAYFRRMREGGLEGDEMGVWVPFPEPNIPHWLRQGADPQDFAVIINSYGRVLKSYFPRVRMSVLLNSITYEEDDEDWSRGESVSLTPWVSGIQEGLVESFGFQGFPWAPPGGQDGQGLEDPRQYLEPALAREAARSLGVERIWINTGTIRTKYAQREKVTVHWSPSKRRRVLHRTLEIGQELEDDGFEVLINVFAEDKSGTEEETDWSYISREEEGGSLEHGAVFADFVRGAWELGIEVGLFDRHSSIPRG